MAMACLRERRRKVERDGLRTRVAALVLRCARLHLLRRLLLEAKLLLARVLFARSSTPAPADRRRREVALAGHRLLVAALVALVQRARPDAAAELPVRPQRLGQPLGQPHVVPPQDHQVHRRAELVERERAVLVRVRELRDRFMSCTRER